MRSFATVLLAAALCGGPASAQTIGGRYTVDGSNPNGSHYGGTAEIIPAGGQTCRILWNVGSTWDGVCLVAERSVAAYYRSGGAQGIAVYDLQPDGTLRGVWTLGANARTGTETLFPAK